MRKLLAVLVLAAGSVVVLGAPASASDCASVGPDLSRLGVSHIEYCGPKPF